MKIAVTYENGQIFQHFGHTEQFKIYEAADGKITHAEVVDTNGSGHGALAGFLMQSGDDGQRHFGAAFLAPVRSRMTRTEAVSVCVPYQWQLCLPQPWSPQE